MNYSEIQQPFTSYRWRWGASTPTESLNIPEVYFGCLQVLHENEGRLPSDAEVLTGLEKIESDLNDDIAQLNLARGQERNLFRNSGQYWKVTGLLEDTSTGITLSPLGRDYASGSITRSEFASHTVKNLVLPNAGIYPLSEISAWNDVGLSIKPLELILKVIVGLNSENTNSGYLTPEEMTVVMIPMCGMDQSVSDIVTGILDYREDRTVFTGSWAANERANDARIAREYLLFLHYYGFLDRRDSRGPRVVNLTQEFCIAADQVDAAQRLVGTSLAAGGNTYPGATSAVTGVGDTTGIEEVIRSRKNALVIERPGQAKFKRDLLDISGGSCVLSGATMREVLHACHIIPVKNNGSDQVSNGFLMRADLHALFDNGHIIIEEDGKIKLSNRLMQDSVYSASLPRTIEIPGYVNLAAVEKRNRYNM